MNIDRQLVKSLRDRLIEIYGISEAELYSYEAAISAHAITSMQTEQPVAYAISAELKNTFKSGERLENSLDDYWNAPSGVGELASQWSDKPHRLLYDLISALIYQPTSLSANEQHTHHAITSMQGDSEPVAYKVFNSDGSQYGLVVDGKPSEYSITHHTIEGRTIQPLFTHDRVKGVSDVMAELERALAVIGVVGKVDGYDVIRRESVLDIARDRIKRSSPSNNEYKLDAERYRWLRSDDIEFKDGMPYVGYDKRMLVDIVTIPLTESELDKAVDEAMINAISQDKGESV